MNILRTVRAEVGAWCLGGLEAGRQRFSLFKQLGRLTTLSTVEIIPLRATQAGQSPEILLVPRPQDDKWWANKLHLPGTVIIPDELGTARNRHLSYDPVVARLFDGEIGKSLELVDGVPRLFDAKPSAGSRGAEQTAFHWAEVTLANGYDKPSVGKFISADDIAKMPEDSFVSGVQETVRRATAHYMAWTALPPDLKPIFSGEW